MKTDHLFYELFRFSPESLLELVKLEAQGSYCFESISVKNTEKRFDVYFKHVGNAGPDIFLEIQGYRDNATPLVVLKPLTLEDKADLPEAVGQWTAGIDEMGLPEDREKTLTELLEYAILQRFKEFTLEEIQKMIQLTPLEETVAGKQLIDMGMEKGHLIGQIQSIQRFLKRPRTPNETLARLDVEELGTVLANLEAELGRLEL